jgi:hypothetical protein
MEQPEASMARPESVAPVDFARESNDLQVQQQTLLDETLDVLLDVFSTVICEGTSGLHRT